MTRARLYLRLGRVSNLPTVWTNALVGMLLVTARIDAAAGVAMAATMSLFYVGGMFLNDAFDRKIDARERPDRPIPAGLIGAAEVFSVGFALLAAGEIALAVEGGIRAALAGLALAAVIVLYNVWHKKNPLSPLVMGLCRVLVYFGAAYGVGGEPDFTLTLGAGVLLSYLMGLTYVAKQENLAEFKNLWPLLLLLAPFALAAHALTQNLVAPAIFVGFLAWVGFCISLLRTKGPGRIPRAVVSLIAGISLNDGLFLATSGHPNVGVVAVAGYAATLFLQRFVSGT